MLKGRAGSDECLLVVCARSWADNKHKWCAEGGKCGKADLLRKFPLVAFNVSVKAEMMVA